MAAWRSSFDGDVTRTWSPWIERLDLLQPWSFRYFTIALRGFGVDALLERDDLADGAARGGLDLAELHVLDRHVAADQPRLQDLPDRADLEVVLGGQDERAVRLDELDGGGRALEVVALRDLLARLVEGVVDLLEVDGGGDVERRGGCHGRRDQGRRLGVSGSSGSSAAPAVGAGPALARGDHRRDVGEQLARVVDDAVLDGVLHAADALGLAGAVVQPQAPVP